MANGSAPSPCPVCGSAADVLTIQDYVDLLGAMHDEWLRRREELRRGAPGRARGGDFGDSGSDAGSAEAEIGAALISATLGLIGRAVGRRFRRRMEEQVFPAIDDRWQQQRQEQLAIAARYPELRGCTRDQVVFLAGGSRTVPLAEVTSQITMAQAESIVGRLAGQ